MPRVRDWVPFFVAVVVDCVPVADPIESPLLPGAAAAKPLLGTIASQSSPNPAGLLMCLQNHRLTPLYCMPEVVANASRREVLDPPPPPPPPPPVLLSCASGGTEGALCAGGSGRCGYDWTRGWHCRCTPAREAARGHVGGSRRPTPPDCVEEYDATSVGAA